MQSSLSFIQSCNNRQNPKEKSNNGNRKNTRYKTYNHDSKGFDGFHNFLQIVVKQNLITLSKRH